VKEAAVRGVADRAIWKPGIPEGIPRTATIKQPTNTEALWFWAGDYAPNELSGLRRPAADFAATLKAYLPAFRHNNRQNMSESSSGIFISVGRSQIFSGQPRPNAGVSLIAMAV
jgi:hypothetical protein